MSRAKGGGFWSTGRWHVAEEGIPTSSTSFLSSPHGSREPLPRAPAQPAAGGGIEPRRTSTSRCSPRWDGAAGCASPAASRRRSRAPGGRICTSPPARRFRSLALSRASRASATRRVRDARPGLVAASTGCACGCCAIWRGSPRARPPVLFVSDDSANWIGDSIGLAPEARGRAPRRRRGALGRGAQAHRASLARTSSRSAPSTATRTSSS